MVSEEGKKSGKATKRPPLRYFFLNDDLHRKLRINRSRDLLVAWNYPDGKKMQMNYTDTLRRMEKAFTTTEVAQLVNRTKVTIENVLLDGHIRYPQHAYTLDENRRKVLYLWREKDIMELHDYLSTVHYGRPRKDGVATPKAMPTPRELRAMIHDDTILYVKQGDTFVPSWRAKNL